MRYIYSSGGIKQVSLLDDGVSPVFIRRLFEHHAMLVFQLAAAFYFLLELEI